MLGRLLVLQQSMDMLPDERHMSDFLCTALLDIPGIRACSLHFSPAEPTPDAGEIILIRSPRECFGELRLKLDDSEAYQSYRPFLDNIAQSFATVLENRRNASGLSEANRRLNRLVDELEQKVLERTSDIMNARQALETSEERLRLALDASSEGIWDWDLESGLAYLSPHFYQMSGYDPQGVTPDFDFFKSIVHPEDLASFVSSIRDHLEGRTSSSDVEYRMITRSGAILWVREKGKVIDRDAHGKPLRMVGTIVDISSLKEKEAALRLAGQVYSSSSEAIFVANSENSIIAVNPAFSEITGYPEPEAIGKDFSFLSERLLDESTHLEILRSLKESGRWHGEILQRRRKGEVFPVQLTIDTVSRDDGSVYRRIGLFMDITERRKSEEIIWRQANFDVLTGLPNRRMFLERLDQEIRKANRAKERIALLFVDLDRFKDVNDSLGHHFGDLLLIEAARRLESCVRETDSVARLGGDEFTVILTGIRSRMDVDRSAAEIVDRLAAPYRLGNEQLIISASVGITLFPDDESSFEQLLKFADQAMYASKEKGRNRYSYYNPSLQDAVQKRVQLSSELGHALENHEFILHFQPIVELSTNKILKAEALVRWLHPSRGLISPSDFIPLAEETGLIVPIGEWVFREAISSARKWSSFIEGNFQVSINLSPAQFRADSTWTGILLQNSGGKIAIEITEGLLLNRDGQTMEKLSSLRKAGVAISLDDFGTGYSSLSYLKQFDIDFLKIDQSFVRDMASDASDFALCEAIIVMAHKLGISVIAEGIETHEQRILLGNMGCDYGQGFLFGKPVPAMEFGKRISREKARASCETDTSSI